MQVLNENRKYQRIRPSLGEKQQLEKLGFQWTLSSFVSAIGKDGNNLLIRFKNGSVYSYNNGMKHYDNMLKSPSKGRYFWRYIRNKLPFKKGTSMPLATDIDIPDEELLEDIRIDVEEKMTKHVKKKVKKETLQLDNLLLKKIVLGGLIYYNIIN